MRLKNVHIMLINFCHHIFKAINQKEVKGSSLTFNLNKLIKNDHYKMEDRKTVTLLLEKNDFLASLDLRDAFFLIPVDVESRKYLRFSFKNTLYQFCCLLFGLNVSPYVFTKILKPVAENLRSKQFRSVFYLDDILLFGRTKSECLENTNETIILLESLGFVLHIKKCCLEPSQIRDYLGFTFDSVDYSISLTNKKRDKLIALCKKYRKKSNCKIREWAQFVGNLVAASPGLKYSNLYIKNFERCKYLALIDSNGDYNKKLYLSEEMHKDLDWWINKLPVGKNNIRNQKYSKEIFSDASLTGWGIFCGDERSHGFWSEEEK